MQKRGQWKARATIKSPLREAHATKQSSFLAAAKEAGLLRFARNDGGETCALFSRPVSPEQMAPISTIHRAALEPRIFAGDQ
jgi:hypothetical protein